jgi:glycosyltransferase involved in cell wall biosynthesis
MVEATLWLHASRLPVVRSGRPYRVRRLTYQGTQRLGALEAARRRRRDHEPPPTPAAFQRRRDVNVERLNRVDVLVAQSARVAELYRLLGVDAERLRTMQLTLSHIEHLTPRRVVPRAPLTFATLAAFESESKGARLVVDAMRALEEHARAGRVRMIVFGHVEPAYREEARAVAGIEVRGRYAPGALDRVLDEVDVGVMPSVWEEAYGYAGIEFLAKGIPVLANAIGGMTDYVHEGETGWLNRPCTADGLTTVMRRLVEHPELVEQVSAHVVAHRGEIVKTMAAHADEVDALYDEVRASAGRR